MALDHGTLMTDWDRYNQLFGELQLHMHKLDVSVMDAIFALIGKCVARNKPMTKAELSATGYKHPLEGQFY